MPSGPASFKTSGNNWRPSDPPCWSRAGSDGAQRTRIVGWLDELNREAERADQRRASLDQGRAGHEAKIAEIDEEIGGLTTERDVAGRQFDEVARKVDGEHDGPSVAEQTVRDYQRRTIASEERLNAERRRESSLASQHATMSEERAVRAERAAAVEGEISALRGQVEGACRAK